MASTEPNQVFIPGNFVNESEYIIVVDAPDNAQKLSDNGYSSISANPSLFENNLKTAELNLPEEIFELCESKKVMVLDCSDNYNLKILAQAVSHQVFVSAVKKISTGNDSQFYSIQEEIEEGQVDLKISKVKGFEKPGYRLEIPYGETVEGELLNYLIPFDVKSKPVLPPVLMQYVEDDGISVKPTNSPMAWLKRNLIVLNKDSDGEYRTSGSTAAEVISEVEAISDDRRVIKIDFEASDFSEKENLLKFGLSGSPAEAAKVFRAQRNSRQVETKKVCKEKGWVKVDGNRHYIYADSSISPRNAEKVEPYSKNSENSVKTAGQKGDYEKWKNVISKLIKENPVQAVTLGFAVSSACLEFQGDSEPGVLHFHGDSSGGKTTTLQIAASLIGRATQPRDPSSWIKGWRTTDNGLERPLQQSTDSPLFLDEIHAAPARIDWESTAYMISNGRGKERMDRNTESRSAPTWRVQLISTGEMSFSEKIRKSTKSHSIPGGLQFRIIDLYTGNINLIESGSDRNREEWGKILGCDISSDADLAENLEIFFSQNYGHFWTFLIEKLRGEDGHDFVKYYDSIRQKMIFEIEDSASLIAKRRTKHAAAAMSGLKMLTDIIGCDNESVEPSAYEFVMNKFLTSGIDDLKGTEAESIQESITTEIHSQASNFYYKGQDSKNNTGSLGWVDREGTLFLPVKKGWKYLCEAAGVDPERAKDAAKQIGWETARSRHPLSGRNSNPVSCIKAVGVFSGFVPKDEQQDDEADRM